MIRKLITGFLLSGLIASAPAITIDRCFYLASQYYQIPEPLLKAIAYTETGMNPYAIGKNTNGSYDIGLMQINSSWLPKLQRVGIEKKELFEPCKNIQVGAWILSENIKRYGMGIRAIGAYNAVTPSKQVVYARKVLRNMKRYEK